MAWPPSSSPAGKASTSRPPADDRPSLAGEEADLLLGAADQIEPARAARALRHDRRDAADAANAHDQLLVAHRRHVLAAVDAGDRQLGVAGGAVAAGPARGRQRDLAARLALEAHARVPALSDGEAVG